MQWVPLASLAAIMRGMSFGSFPVGETRIVRGRNLRTDELDLSSLACKALPQPLSCPVTECGDVLLQKLGDRPAAYLVSERDVGLAVSDTVFLGRLSAPYRQCARLLTAFFNSDQGATVLTRNANTTTVPTQTLRNLGRMCVPILSAELATSLLAALDHERLTRANHALATKHLQDQFNRLAGASDRSFCPSVLD